MNDLLKSALALVFFIALLVGGALFVTSFAQAGSSPASGHVTARSAVSPQPVRAPDFSVTDLDGLVHRLSDSHEKPMVLYFFASWCPNCRNDLDAVDRVYGDYQNRISFVAVDLDSRESRATVQSYARSHHPGVAFAVASNDVLRKYGVQYTTTKYALVNGQIVWSRVGGMAEANWRALFDSLVSA